MAALLLLIIIPLYLLALMAIIDALKATQKRRFMPDSMVTPTMRIELVNGWIKNKAMTAEHGDMYINGLLTPLSGWGYAYEMRDFNPPCQLELKLSDSERYTMNAVNQAIVSEAVKALMRDYRKSERAIKKQERAYAKAQKARGLNLVPAMA